MPLPESVPAAPSLLLRYPSFPSEASNIRTTTGVVTRRSRTAVSPSTIMTPNYILVLFITSVLGAAWCIATLFRRRATRESAFFVSFIDLCFIGALIASVVEMRAIATVSCTTITTGPFYLSLGPFGYFGQESNSPFAINIDRTCAMLKACFAFGIMNCIFFFNTMVLLWFMRKHRDEGKERVVRRHR